jgi:uncharacterized protein (DUF3084 family)
VRVNAAKARELQLMGKLVEEIAAELDAEPGEASRILASRQAGGAKKTLRAGRIYATRVTSGGPSSHGRRHVYLFFVKYYVIIRVRPKAV